jgi:hypothetical protein
MRRNHAIWLGPLVTFVGAVSYFTYFARFPSLRDVPWLNLPIVAFGVWLSALGIWRALRSPGRYRGKIAGSSGLLLSLALALLFGFYVFSLSYGVPQPTETTLSLSSAPGFTLPDQNGNEVRLSDLRGRKVVLVFYRGFW